MAQLPPGFVLEEPEEGAVLGLPEGFVLESASEQGQPGKSSPRAEKGAKTGPSDLGAARANELGREISGKSVAGFLGMPINLVNLARKLGDLARQKVLKTLGVPEESISPAAEPLPGGSGDIEKVLEFVTGKPLEAPDKSTAEEYLTKAGSAGGAGLPFGPAGTGLNVISALAEETAGQVTKGTEAEGTARTVTGLAAPLVAGGIQRLFRPTTTQMLKGRAGEITSEEFAQAEALQAQAQKVGVPLSAPEALDSPTLQRLAADVRASKGGGEKMESFLRKRPEQVEEAVTKELGKMGPEVPPVAATEQLQKTAGAVVEKVQKSRSRLAGPFYEKAQLDEVDPKAIERLTQLTDEAIALLPKNLPARRELESFKASLQREAGEGATVAETRMQPLTDIYKTYRDRVALSDISPEVVDKTTFSKVNPLLQEMKRIMEETSPAWQKANKVYEELSERLVRPVAEGQVGKAVNQSTMDGMAKVIFKPSEVDAATLRKTVSELGTVDPGAARDLARSYLSQQFDAASEKLMAGPNLAVGAKFDKAVMGTPKERENMQALLESVAQAQGLPKTTYWFGFQRLMKVLERTGRIPGVGSPSVSRAGAEAEAQASKFGSAMKTAQLADPLMSIRSKWDNWVGSRNFSELADILTAPDSVPKLRQLMLTDPQSNKAALIAAELLGASRSEERTEEADSTFIGKLLRQGATP